MYQVGVRTKSFCHEIYGVRTWPQAVALAKAHLDPELTAGEWRQVFVCIPDQKIPTIIGEINGPKPADVKSRSPVQYWERLRDQLDSMAVGVRSVVRVPGDDS